MARPRKFTEDEVVAAAMRLFWQHGYERTTMRLLERETGVGLRSLANAFGDKDKLFVRALRLYREAGSAHLEHEIDHPGRTGRGGLIRFFQALPVCERGSPMEAARASGCLVVNTLAARAGLDPALRSAVDEEIVLFRDALLARFEAALLRDDVGDAHGRARFLLAALWGALAQIALAGDPRAAEPAVDVVVDTIRGWEPRGG